MNPIRWLRSVAGLTQASLARAAGTSQSTVAAYESGRKSPTLDTLWRLAASVDLEASVAYHRPMTREERRSLALHRQIAERLAADPERVLARARANLARMSAGAARSSPFLKEWSVILERPLPGLVSVLVDPDPWARELRQTTPFAGVLTAGERAATYRAFADAERARRR